MSNTDPCQGCGYNLLSSEKEFCCDCLEDIAASHELAKLRLLRLKVLIYQSATNDTQQGIAWADVLLALRALEVES